MSKKQAKKTKPTQPKPKKSTLANHKVSLIIHVSKEEMVRRLGKILKGESSE